MAAAAQPTPARPEDASPCQEAKAATPAMVQVRDLRKVFQHGGRELAVLKGITIDLGAREMLSVVGMSGAGKSTMLHILGALDRPSSGKILFEGKDLVTLGVSQLAAFRNRSIGFVFQFHHLLPEFTAVENVMMSCLIARISRKAAIERASDLLASVGLGDRLAHRPGELSGGEQQRVALARALVMRPKLLLADEPTGNLDSRTSGAIHDLFFELNEQMGTTMLIVTHNPELARRMPRQLRMLDGRLVEGDEKDAADAAEAAEAAGDGE
ncbi:MAG: ABC transporter ATP-binding protein [Deltaproteobacteria bacterium]|nr:MAG: ABC transporter ATP-binding protein [Pseudomonadota bacterium]PIE66138.1 MAG: ABC transporter ATP-binding protein [Deltaproteobacteria bacterium]